MAMTRAEIIERIKFDLGYPTIKIEIDDTAWGAIFSRTLSWFKAKKGLIGCTEVYLVEGVYEYDYPNDANEIVDVIFPTQDTLSMITSLCFFDIIPIYGYSLGGAWYSPGAFRFDSSQYVQLLQALEQRRRVLNSEASWYDECRKIIVTTKSPLVGGRMRILYKKDTIDIPDFFDARDQDMVYRYALATAKMVLGRTLRKYSQYPSAGGMINTDGGDLIADAKEEIAVLEEEIIGSQGNAGGIVTG